MSAELEGVGLSRRSRSLIVRTRWVLVITVAYVMLYASSDPVPLWPHQLLVLGALVSNVFLWLILRRGADWKRWRYLFTTMDIAAVTLAVSLVDSGDGDFYLAYFAVLVLSTVVPHIGIVTTVTLFGVLAYGTTLFVDLGASLWSDSSLLVRLPFLFSVALYFGTIVHEARREQSFSSRLEEEARHIAQRAKQLAKEQYRLQALSEIGRLGLSGVRSEPGKILYDIIGRVQRVVGVDRASLVIFERDGAQAYVAASGDDPHVEVRVITLEEYPELRHMLNRGEITELYPGQPKELWKQVQECLPPANPFRAFLIVPIQRGNRLHGAFYLRDVRPDHRYTEEDRNFCWTAAMMTAAFIHGQDLLEQLRTQSRRDSLTGLLNFQAFTEEAGAVMRKADRRAHSLVVADLDNLKEVNDRWGHTAGNRLIITTGQSFSSSLGNVPTVCRYGGDEFVALVAGTKEETSRRLQGFLQHLEKNEARLPKPPRISIGVSQYPDDGENLEQVLDSADQAMYLAKNDGGHRIYSAGEAETGMSSSEYQRAVLEAVVNVQARRYMADEDRSVREILAPLAEANDTTLDSPLVRQTLKALMDSVESKDPHTRAHSEAVSRLARRLAEAMRFPLDQQSAIAIAGLVHDVGKIGVPAEILRKQGKLTNVERQVVERHPEIAAELLSQIPPLRDVVPLVFHHQERWDGSGYPGGLKGEQIPPGAQVVALADAYDALTSARAHRSAFSPDEAVAILERDAGKLWNPALVQAFLEHVIAIDGPATAAAASAGESVGSA